MADDQESNDKATSPAASALPADDPTRTLTHRGAEAPPHIGLVGDTYTVLVSGKDSAGRYCLIDMHIPPGGGPPPHRHDFEETFSVLAGEIEATFRGATTTVKTGETIHIPARLFCICSPAGQEEFFALVGIPVGGRTEAPPALDEAGEAEFRKKAGLLAPQYRTEFVKPA